MASNMEDDNGADQDKKPSPRFSVRYLGSMCMDRLYPQSMQPLVMAEIHRKKDEARDVTLEVVGEALLIYPGTNTDSSTGNVLEEQQHPFLEHHLSGLTRFAKLHQDPLCFAYLTRYQLNADFECHVFMASSEEIIPQLFKAIREASKDVHSKPAPSATKTTTATTTASSQAMQQQQSGTSISQTASSPCAGSVQDVTEVVDQSSSLFEVKYLGWAKLTNKRVNADYIDQVAEKMIAREEDLLVKKLEQVSRDKKRHPSNTSVRSLPDNLDDSSSTISENNLVEQKENLNQNKGGLRLSLFKRGSLQENESSVDEMSSNDGSSDNITGIAASCKEGGPPSLHMDFRSDSDGSREKLDEKEFSSSSQAISPNVGSSVRRRHASALASVPMKRSESPLLMKKTSLDDSVLTSQRDDNDHVTSIPHVDSNRTMLFQISNHDISLFSLERKSAVMERIFKDISFVSQGSHRQDIFGIVVREAGSFICYILQCLTDAVVAEIMGTLQLSFSAAYKKQGGASSNSGAAVGSGNASQSASPATQHQVCTSCPLHQLHKLCQEIHSMSPQAAHDLLLKKVHNLPERELNKIRQQMQVEAPESFEESVEVMMICLRRMCEGKQREHAHLSVGSKNAKPEINLVEEKQNLFEGLRNKARKSLTTSFENLIHRGRSKKEDAKENFRQRSWTADNETTNWMSRESSSATSTPDASPMPSPSPMSRDVHHEFPSPPGSPTTATRKRSFTLGAIPDSPRGWSSTNNATTGSLSSDAVAERRRRDMNHNKTVVSPIKTMYLLSSHGGGHSQDSSLVSSSSSPSAVPSPAEDPHHALISLGGLPGTAGGGRRQSLSWRKAIFERVCTPQHAHDDDNDESAYDVPISTGTVPTHTEVRALWKKVILETLLLIRMEKENHNLRARQEDGDSTISRKLDYQELTPCLKEITSIWEDMLGFHEEERDREEEEIKEGYKEEEEEKGETPSKEEEEEDRGREQRLIPQGTLLDCVSKGVPRKLRGQIWLFLMQQYQMGATVPDSVCDSVNYDDLLKQLTTHQHAILIDLGRTFPGHPYFSKALGPGQLELFNLLKAYSLLDLEVGYCQGISFIVGMLLMHMEEISAFHVLKFLMYDLGLRKQFKPNMVALQMKLYQLTRLLHDHYKDIYEHFENHDISPTLYAAPWFLTLFASQFPLGFVARVFDMIFVQGIDSLFKIALVLLGSHRALILQCDSFESIVGFLKTTLPEMVQVQMERIINQAFELDITKELQAYEIEYHVLREEMTSSPSQGFNKGTNSQAPLSNSSSMTEDKTSAPWHRIGERRQSTVDLEMVYRLEHHNRCLKQQNMDLLEKLQHAQAQIRSNEHSIHGFQLSEEKHKSQLRTLELERSALLTAVAKLRKLVPREALLSLNLSPSTLQAMSPTSPINNDANTNVAVSLSNDSIQTEQTSFPSSQTTTVDFNSCSYPQSCGESQGNTSTPTSDLDTENHHRQKEAMNRSHLTTPSDVFVEGNQNVDSTASPKVSSVPISNHPVNLPSLVSCAVSDSPSLKPNLTVSSDNSKP